MRKVLESVAIVGMAALVLFGFAALPIVAAMLMG